jgi:hypothetical protein
MWNKRLQDAEYRRTDVLSPATAPSPIQAPMAASLVQARPTTLSMILPDLVVQRLFSLLGLTLSAAMLSSRSASARCGVWPSGFLKRLK